MPEAYFYGGLVISKEQLLIKLLFKALESKKRSLVFSESSSMIEKLDNDLWTKTSFLPHAKADEPNKNMQKVLLSTDSFENGNNPDFLFTVDNSNFLNNSFEKVFIIFDLSNQEDVINARTKWNTLKSSNFSLKYFRQSGEGKFLNENL